MFIRCYLHKIRESSYHIGGVGTQVTSYSEAFFAVKRARGASEAVEIVRE